MSTEGKMTDLTIIFPAYNDRSTLQDMLEQLADQACPFPIIIVDDCSQDDTEDMVAQMASARGLAITYLRNERNMGPGPSRNTGVAHCATRYFTFLDADDHIKRHYSHYMAKIVVHDFDVAITKYDISRNRDITHTGLMHQVDSQVLNPFWNRGSPIITDREDIWSCCEMIAFPWNKVYSKAFYDRIGATFPDRRLHEDILPHWQVLLNAETLYFDFSIPSLLTHFEVADGTRATNAKTYARLEAYEDLVTVLSWIQKDKLQTPFESLADFVRDLDGWIMKDVGNPEEIPVELRRLRLDLLTGLNIRQ